MFSVQFYRNGALARAYEFIAWIQGPFSAEYEGLYCVSPQPPFAVRDLTEIIADDLGGACGDRLVPRLRGGFTDTIQDA